MPFLQIKGIVDLVVYDTINLRERHFFVKKNVRTIAVGSDCKRGGCCDTDLVNRAYVSREMFTSIKLEEDNRTLGRDKDVASGVSR